MPRPIKVLIAEDNPLDAELALRELYRAGFEPDWQRVDTETAFVAALHQGLDLILSDYAMPQFSGIRALELMKQSGLEIPFILVSGTIGEDTAVTAMRLGAADYLLKDRLTRLGAAVTQALAGSRLRRERLQAEEALRVAHAQLGQLLEHSPAVLYRLKLGGQTIEPNLVSKNIFPLLGFTVEEASRHGWWQGQVHPEDLERVAESLNENSGAGAKDREYRLRHKDGNYRWVNDARRLIRDAADKPVELIGVWTDITERKRAEETVRQASGFVVRDRRKQMYVELGIFCGATTGLYVAAKLSHWFDWVTRWFLAHDVAELDEIILTAIFVAVGLTIFAFRRWRETETELTGRHQTQAAMGLLHDELDRQVRQRTSELDNANQALRAEIVERKHAETVLDESNRRFREMLENVELIAMTLDNAGLVTFCNDFLLRVTGWTREQVVGLPWFEKFLPESAAATKQVFFDAISAERFTPHHQNAIKTRTGEIREIIWNNTMLRDVAGTIVGTASIGEDITARSQAEHKIREQLDELLRWQEVMLNREDRVEALKIEVNEELGRRGEPSRYASPAAQ